jgi:acyl-CoA synthetase (NDP forming)
MAASDADSLVIVSQPALSSVEGNHDNSRLLDFIHASLEHYGISVSALSDATRHKPVIIIKAGASTQGAQAASSHTGSLAGDDVIFDSIVHECGAIRARSIRECIHLIKMASYHVVPKGPQMRVITNAGGCGVLAADAIEKAGLRLAHLYVHRDSSCHLDDGKIASVFLFSF